MSKLKLIAIPCAGASAMMYFDWKNKLSDDIYCSYSMCDDWLFYWLDAESGIKNIKLRGIYTYALQN